jgi:hypothetical protein
MLKGAKKKKKEKEKKKQKEKLQKTMRPLFQSLHYRMIKVQNSYSADKKIARVCNFCFFFFLSGRIFY